MPTFLAPLLRRSPPSAFVVRNARTGAVVIERLATAFDSASRRTGLLRHDALAEGSGLIIAPTQAIHTCFMRFPIDVAFVTKAGIVVKARAAVRPWRVAGSLRAHAAIELPAGTLERTGTRAGDRLVIAPRTPADAPDRTS